MSGDSKQRKDADNAFLRVQTKSLVRDRIMSEADSVAQARDANTVRLKELRLRKEELDREAAANAPPVKKTRKRS